jgi:hypothetical protein
MALGSFPFPPASALRCPRPDCGWVRHDIPTVHITSRARRLREHEEAEHSDAED